MILRRSPKYYSFFNDSTGLAGAIQAMTAITADSFMMSFAKTLRMSQLIRQVGDANNSWGFAHCVCKFLGLWDLLTAFAYPWPCHGRSYVYIRSRPLGACGVFHSKSLRERGSRHSCYEKRPASSMPSECKRDPVGIRTQDPQLRRLLLYPTELPDRSVQNQCR